MSVVHSGAFSIKFTGETDIYERTIKCTIRNDEFNYSYNPTLLKSGSIEEMKDFVNSGSFSPYATTIGFYNDSNDLLMVAKFARPIPFSEDIDYNIVIKIDQ